GAGMDLAGFQQVFPDWFCSFCLEHRWVEVEDSVVRPQIVIVPKKDCLFLSDAFHLVAADAGSDFTLPASTNAADMLSQFMFDTPVDRALDLCTGCGVHGLLATGFANHVLASDISANAVNFAATNALLNGRDNIEFVESDFFANIEHKDFDLIVTNPPFVIGPKQDFVYRDNPMDLDNLCGVLAQEACNFLKDGGYLQMLCEWVEIEGQRWEERLRGWLDPLPCDAWILRSQPRSPQDYVRSRLTDLSGPKTNLHTQLEEWEKYFTHHKVSAIHPGMIILRKRQGNNWFHVHNLVDPPTGPVTGLIKDYMKACDTAAELSNDTQLLGAKLSLAEELELEQKFVRNDHQWQPRAALLTMQNALPVQGEMDLPVLALLNLFDGKKSTQNVIGEFAKASGAHLDELTPKLMPVLKVLIQRGFLKA
ncbi:MAG: class I SAM-dependent methyltransferase, partial [Pseudomonadota bacterium]